jgi:ubiquinone/menaquinone biosynthesis C-methylase UbiE
MTKLPLSVNNENNSFEDTEQFFNQQWDLYQKVLAHNYMGHQELYAVLHQFLVSQYSTPFRMLDLGCGDASFSAQALVGTQLEAYWGVDLSESALELAHSNMAKLPGEKSFMQDNLLDWVLEKGQSQNFDVILTSFALHHLSLEQKDALLAQLPQLLKTGGVFLLIDVMRQPNEARSAYIDRYLDNVRQFWSWLTPQEVARVEEHISSSDFPETQETFYALAQKHRFSRVDCLYRDPLDTAQLLCFHK